MVYDANIFVALTAIVGVEYVINVITRVNTTITNIQRIRRLAMFCVKKIYNYTLKTLRM